MNTKQITTNLISVAVTGSLYFGTGALHDFAYHFIAILVVLSVVCLLVVGVTEEASAEIRKYFPLSLALSIAQIYALAATGHPFIAALSFIVSALIIALSFELVKA